MAAPIIAAAAALPAASWGMRVAPQVLAKMPNPNQFWAALRSALVGEAINKTGSEFLGYDESIGDALGYMTTNPMKIAANAYVDLADIPMWPAIYQGMDKFRRFVNPDTAMYGDFINYE